MGCFSRDYVCCAIPLYNVGIYCILIETGAIALTTGVLALAAPTIVAVSIPSFGPYILGGICLVIVALQFWGFYGVFKEKARVYRTFVRTNISFIAVALLLALVWIILSMVNHNKGRDACVAQFTAVGQTQTRDGETICNIFTWVQVGLLGFLWIFLTLAQAYFLHMERIYGFEQRRDHAKYNSVYSTLGEEIALRKSGVYSDRDRPSLEGMRGHARADSKVSALRNEVKMNDSYDNSRRNSLRYNDPFAAPSSLSPHAARSLSRPRSGDMRNGGNSSAVSISRSAHQYPPPSSSAVRSPGGQSNYSQLSPPSRLPSPGYQNGPTPIIQNFAGVGSGPSAAFAGPRHPTALVTGHPTEGSGGRKTPRYDSPY